MSVVHVLSLAGAWLTVAVTLVIAPLLQRAESLRAGTWPQARGVIVESRISFKDGDHGFKHKEHHFRYAYEVAGTRHVEDRYATWGGAAIAVRRYKKGDAVRVYYDPEWPNRAVLDPRPMKASVVCGMVALGVAVCILGPLWLGRRGRPQRARV